MATGYTHKTKKNSVPMQKKSVRIFITSYTDEFHAERDLFRKEILPELKAWCESKQLSLSESFIKWGSKRPEKRDVNELERAQTSIETCYYNKIMPIFVNITSESIGLVPMWGEYSDDQIEDYIEAYGLLVEDLEVMNGAYREDNHNILFLLRDDNFIKESVPANEQGYFLKETQASLSLKKSGSKISQKISPSRLLKYKVQYEGLDQKRKPQIKFNECFKEMVLNFCMQKIAFDFLGEQLQMKNIADTSVKHSHQQFMINKAQCVLGRSDYLQKIDDYLFREEKDVPLLIVGGTGCGKSSIICKVVSNIEQSNAQCPLEQRKRIFYYFVGAVPGSYNVEDMLDRLLRDMEVVNDSNMPKGLESSAQICCSSLSNPNTKPIIIFVDGLNQFNEDQGASVLSWLPRKLAPQVRCVFSAVKDSKQHHTLINRETKPIVCEVGPLDLESREKIVTALMGEYHKSLSKTQMTMLMQKETSANPLWLTVACEELQLLRSDVDVDNTIKQLPDDLLNLMEYLLIRLEGEDGGNLVIATLCLLEASTSGLMESELRQILGNENTLMPPSVFDEKEEKESSEKECKKCSASLSDLKWDEVFSKLRPYLRPYGTSTEGRLDLYHRALSKAVRKRFFEKADVSDEATGDKTDSYLWWHKKLADYFEHHCNVDRLVEEYPFQLVCLDDKYRLAECLCDWRIFDKLYHEEFSSKLLEYWRKVGTSTEMISRYEKALAKYEEDDSVNEENVSIRYEKVCRVVIQAGKYLEALELLRTAMKIEEKELGARPHRMVELYALMAEIYDEKLKLNDFVSASQLPDLRKTIHYGRKSISLRKKLPGSYHRFKLGMSLMKLAFNMESWEACGGGPELTGEAALTEGNKYIDRALKIFEELNDVGHYAEALMTKGVLARRGSMEQLKFYNEAMDLCMQIYGEYHILTSRLYINIGIVYEDNNDFKKAYDYFKKWAKVSEQILGPDHPKTQRAKGVLRESRYQRIARNLGEADEPNNDEDRDEDEAEEEEEEIQDLEHFYDDHISQGSVIELDNIMIDTLTSNVQELSVEGSGVVANQIQNNNSSNELMNGYFEENASQSEESGSDHENSDNENVYDDNFEDYEENYILSSDNGPVIEDFNVDLENDEEEDEEIVQITSREPLDNEGEQDNRFCYDGRETSDVDADNDETECINVRSGSQEAQAHL